MTSQVVQLPLLEMSTKVDFGTERVNLPVNCPILWFFGTLEKIFLSFCCIYSLNVYLMQIEYYKDESYHLM